MKNFLIVIGFIWWVLLASVRFWPDPPPRAEPEQHLRAPALKRPTPATQWAGVVPCRAERAGSSRPWRAASGEEKRARLAMTWSAAPGAPEPMLRYTLVEDARVTLTIFNLLGQEVMTVLDEAGHAGSRFVRIDTSALTGGMYFCRLQAGGESVTRRLLLLK